MVSCQWVRATISRFQPHGHAVGFHSELDNEVGQREFVAKFLLVAIDLQSHAINLNDPEPMSLRRRTATPWLRVPCRRFVHRGLGASPVSPYSPAISPFMRRCCYAMSRWGGFDPSDALGVAAVLGRRLLPGGVGADHRRQAAAVFRLLSPRRELMVFAALSRRADCIRYLGIRLAAASVSCRSGTGLRALTAKLVTFVALPVLDHAQPLRL